MKKISFFLLTAFIASSVFILPTYAEEATSSLTSEELTCIQDAITTRDSVLLTAYDTFTTAVKSALSARTETLKSAWTKSSISEIQAALIDAWKAYRRSIVSARIDLRRAKVATWQAFHTEKSTCFTDNKAGVDTSTMMSDAQL